MDLEISGGAAISGSHPTNSAGPSPSAATASANTPTTGTPACAYAECTLFSDNKPQLMKALYHSNNPLLDKSFGKTESTYGIKREEVVYGVPAALGLYLIFGAWYNLFVI
jgi:hypothetical protein